MINSDCFPEIIEDLDMEDISSVFQSEKVIEVEIPVRGLLIKESVVVSNCDSDHVEAQTSNISHFCTGTYNYPLFIRERNTNRILTCRLNDLLVYSGKLMLNNFGSFDQSWVDREFERVQPKLPLYANMVTQKQRIRVNVFDLSQNGMCLLIGKNGVVRKDEITGKPVQISVTLPGQSSICKIKGKVVQSRSIANNLIRVGIETNPSKKDAKIIAHYLSDRKREILDDLFLNFMQLMNYRETKDQYF